MTPLRFPFEGLKGSDLVPGAIYEGGPQPNLSSEVISKVAGCGNRGGFRPRWPAPRGRYGGEYAYVVLHSTLGEIPWPDRIDVENRALEYFGDNRTPGTELYDTPLQGNATLRRTFEKSRSRSGWVPPFFVFTSRGGHDVCFEGIAVPGHGSVKEGDWLKTVDQELDGGTCVNYLATFELLNSVEIPREWLEDLRRGEPWTDRCPSRFRDRMGWRPGPESPILPECGLFV